MFGNMNESTIEVKKKSIKNNKKIDVLANVLNKKYFAIYVIAFLISLVELTGDFSVFSISILGACLSFSIPILGVVAFSMIGNFIKFGMNGFIEYSALAIALLISLFLIKPIYNEKERNEKIKIGFNIFIATLILQLIKIGFSTITLYDILSSITLSIMAVVFYKIFVNSIVVMKDFSERRAFSIEEVIGTSILIAIAATGLGEISVYGLSIRNIINILIVMILGWRNGILVGATSGVAIGMTVGTITHSDPIMIAAYSISGMISGLLNKFGKIGVVVGFISGNILLAYLSNGNTIELIHFKEILIASLGLLALPKKFEFTIEEFMGRNKLFPIMPSNALGKSKMAAQSLNNVSEVIDEMSTGYEELELEESKQNNKDIFIAELLNTLDPYKDNIIYEDIANVNGEIINKIFEILLEKQKITIKELLNVFSECNSYIVGFDDKEIGKYLDESLSQMVTIINMSYKVSKSEFIWRKKEEANKRNLGKQLKGLSKAIHSIAKGIEDEKDLIKFPKEEKEIISIFQSNGFTIKELDIEKKSRYSIRIFLNKEYELVDEINKIESILTKVLKETIIYNEYNSDKDMLNFISEDKFTMTMGKATKTKDNSDISGDNIINMRLKDGKYFLALSDGMGTGKKANASSKKVLNMLEGLLLSGFDKETSIDLINRNLIGQQKEMFATMDIAIIDLYTGNVEFIKSGACPTYIKNKKNVKLIKSNSLPTGIVEENKVQTFEKNIEEGDMVILCSDGILDSNVEYKNKELWLKYILEDIETKNTQKVADIIMNEAIDNNYGIAKDDMSVIVFKFNKK